MTSSSFTPRSPGAITLSQALDGSPSLARLAAMSDQSNAMLRAVQTVLPATLRASVKAGPVDSQEWCLLVTGNAAAAKVRQLMPRLQAELQGKGWDITSIRLKVVSV